MSLFNLRDAGEMVYIIPRSWTSGAYFKRFRQEFFRIGALEHIHLFVSRDKVFEKESVLQETIIIKVKKTATKPNTITVSTTQNNRDFTNRTIFEGAFGRKQGWRHCASPKRPGGGLYVRAFPDQLCAGNSLQP